ncbi:F-box protein CPR1-like [Macadamia integrifolia]|uniref:F-box protein CPR1-like n=1 Tax=Macadamia integrifolia TaxID=60698 RepID=UPI001C4FB7D8|nr:F-box protein CPR1-like [Macadamia integrifolia]
MPSKNLSEDLIIGILSRLPVKSLLRFRCVCKPWCALITDSAFIKMHLTQSLATNTNLTLIVNKSKSIDLYSVDLDACELNQPFKSPIFRPTDILGSCNGLLCISNCNNDMYLWNPSTRSHHKLPSTPTDYIPYHCAAYGFGYDPTTDDYKLIRVWQFYRNDDNSWHSEVKVYSLSTNSWRMIGDMPFPPIKRQWVCGVLANSALHWVANVDLVLAKVSPGHHESGLGLIVSFDLKDEEYREVPLPDFMDDVDIVDDKFLMKVGVLEGQLCLLINFSIRVEIWVMKDYGVRDSWLKQFSNERRDVIQNFFKVTPVCYLKNGEVILRGSHRPLLLYDPHRGRTRLLRTSAPGSLDIDFYLGRIIDIDICVGSLVPLNIPRMELNKKKIKKRKQR